MVYLAARHHYFLSQATHANYNNPHLPSQLPVQDAREQGRPPAVRRNLNGELAAQVCAAFARELR